MSFPSSEASGRRPGEGSSRGSAASPGQPAASPGSLIQQRLKTDCAICTIAMALGLNYEAVMAAAIEARAYKPEEGTRAEYMIIEQFGLQQMKDFRCLHRGPLAPEYFLHFSWGRRAILAVPSLNIEGSFHSVYWDGARLLDPCTAKIYSDWSQLRPDEIILLHERSDRRGDQ